MSDLKDFLESIRRHCARVGEAAMVQVGHALCYSACHSSAIPYNNIISSFTVNSGIEQLVSTKIAFYSFLESRLVKLASPSDIVHRALVVPRCKARGSGF